MNFEAGSQPKALEIEARVIRCGCTLKQKKAPTWHALSGAVCPNPRRVEELGKVAAWYRNPFRRLTWRFSQLLRGRRPGVVRAIGD